MSKKKRKRVEFTFDERSFTTLEEMTEGGRFPPMGRTKQEFHEIVVHNPETGEEETIIIPVLEPLSKGLRGK